jgi:hypothetical protein
MVARVHAALALRLKLKLWERTFVGIYKPMVCYLSLALFRKIQNRVLKEERV